MTHTPGPWRVVDDGNGGPTIRGTAEIGENDLVADVRLPADALLIAAAPDLLAACKAASEFDYEEPMPDGRFPCDLVAAAIAKAEGS